MSVEKILKYLLSAAGIVLGLFLLPFVFRLFAPFIVAFALSIPCRKIVDILQKKFHISRGISSAAIATFIVCIFLGGLIFLGYQAFLQSGRLFSSLPLVANTVYYRVTDLSQRFDGYIHTLPPQVSALFDNLFVSFGDYAHNLSQKAASTTINAAKNAAGQLPGIFLFATMFILATFFFTKDFNVITNYLDKILPRSFKKFLSNAKLFLASAFSCFLKAQLQLMIITSVLVTICLWIIGKDYALIWGIVCGFVDALPFFGTAIILVPWAFVGLLYGDLYTFFALIIVQALVFVVRQLIEPKIVSRQIGIHPILTLISIYAGLRLFGFMGMIFAPFLTMLAINIYASIKKQSAS